jgi:hypothetical protein
MDVLKEVHSEHKADLASRRQTAGEAAVKESKAKASVKRRYNPDRFDEFVDKANFTDSRLNRDELRKVIQKHVDRGILRTNQDVERAIGSIAKSHEKEIKSGKSLVDKKTGEDRMLPHHTAESWLSGKKETRTSFEANLKSTAATTGINERDLKQAADDLWASKYAEMERRNQILSDIKKQHGITAKDVSGERGSEDSDSIQGLDDVAAQVAAEYPELGIERTDNDAADKLFHLIQKGPEKLPLKSSDEFMQEVLQSMGAEDGDPFEEKPIDHPDILNAALNRINQGIYGEF